jgi:hypothetical protein
MPSIPLQIPRNELAGKVTRMLRRSILQYSKFWPKIKQGLCGATCMVAEIAAMVRSVAAVDPGKIRDVRPDEDFFLPGKFERTAEIVDKESTFF